ncbi:MAG TPA: hypothetical protein VGE43_07075 [Acidimicrobiales bacterium]
MPVAQTRGHAGKALLIAGVAVGLLLVLTWVVAQAANRGDVEIRLGDDRFDAGQASAIAKTIDQGDGLPILYSDLIGEGRNLLVQHLGDDPEEGWIAFGAWVPEDPSCTIDFTDDRDGLEDCDGREQPLDGEGLRAYPTTVEDGRVYVDINELSTSTTEG